MAEPWEWKLPDIDGLIRGRVQESLVLDYKASAALSKDSKTITELSKDVSAFANSDGGTLVYGVTQDDQNYPSEVDVGTDPTKISAEWIGQIIDNRISPRIHGYRINAIALPSGKALYVVHVPQSETAHMADDNRYYRRSDCRSVPMEDFEVRDVMGRSKTADFRLDFRLASGGTKLFVYGENFSAVPVPYFVAFVYLGQGSEPSHPSLNGPVRCRAQIGNREPFYCDSFQVNYSADVPLMQGIQIDILKGTAITMADLPRFEFFAWETITPGRINREGRRLDENQGRLATIEDEKWSVERPRPDLRR